MSECTPMVVLPGTSGFTPSTGAARSNVTTRVGTHISPPRTRGNPASHRIERRTALPTEPQTAGTFIAFDQELLGGPYRT